MTAFQTLAKSQIFESFPARIQASLTTYAEETGLPVFAVVTFAISHSLNLPPLFLSEPMQNGVGILSELPVEIQQKVQEYVVDDPMPSELVVEMAVASFLDYDAVTFRDCKPWVNQERIDLIKHGYAQVKAAD